MVVISDTGELNITGDMETATGLRVSNNKGQKLRQRFDIISKLGQGTYGKVQLALNRDSGKEVAIKTIKKAKIETEQDLARIQREIQIMSSVQHPHIIHIYEVFENKEKIVLVMEYASRGELYDYLSGKKALGDCEARRLFRQIVSAVYYCHKNKICHRDLKLENILLDENGNAKIADFGLSNVFDEKNMLSTFCGSPLYASPEIVKGTPYYGPEVDCWSLGVLLYTLVYGAMPFDGSNFRRLVKQISEGDYYEPKQPSEASSLIRRMLTVSPSKRASIEEVCTDWWVNLGYQDSLLTVSEGMCLAMPVRLDYLLKLVPSNGNQQGGDEAALVPQTDATSADATTDATPADATTTDATPTDATLTKVPSLTKRDEIEDNGKNVSMEASKVSAVPEMDIVTTGDDSDETQACKKHKLSSSAKSVVSDSTEKVGTMKRKKKKSVDKESEEHKESNKKKTELQGARGDSKTMADSDVKNNEPFQEEKIKRSHEKIATDVHLQEEETDSKKASNEATEKLICKTGAMPSEQKPKLEEKQITTTAHPKQLKNENVDMNKESIKTDKLCSQRSTEETETANDKLAETARQVDEIKKADEPAETKKSTKPKLSLKISSSSKQASEPSPDSTTPSSRRGSKTNEKLVFPALKVSEARKAFESKPPEKKSLVIPGLKVSAARKAFETPGNTSEKSVLLAKSVPAKTSVKSKSQTDAAVSRSASNESAATSNKAKDESAIKSTSEHKPESATATASSGTLGQESQLPVKSSIEISSDTSEKPINENNAMGKETKEASPPSSQQKTANFVPTLDVSVAVKPPKKTTGKPPAAPSRSSIDNSGTSSNENTPEATKLTSSPLTKPTVRKASLSKPSSPTSKEMVVPTPVMTSNSDTETDKKFQGASSKDICGSESSFLARAFLNKNSDNPAIAGENETVKENDCSSSTVTEPIPIQSETKQTKITTVEIQLSPKLDTNESFAQRQSSSSSQPPLVLPSVPGKFMLLGVKSEVSFDVDAPSESVQVTAPLPPPPAPPQKHQTLYMNVTLPAPPPCTPSPDIECSEKKEISSPTLETSLATDSPTSAMPRERIIPVQMEQMSGDGSRQGYNVYRSKFNSARSSRLGDTERRRPPSLERSESLSSTGSTDDLEDIFDSLTGDSMLSGILARTRTIIDELSRDNSSRRFGSLFGRMGASGGSASQRRDIFQDFFSKKDWFKDMSSDLGSSRYAKDSKADLHGSECSGSRSWRTTGVPRTSPPETADPYLSDSGLRTRRGSDKGRQWKSFREDDYVSDSGTRSSSLRSGYNSSYAQSMSNSISEEEDRSESNRYAGRINNANDSSVFSDSGSSYYALGLSRNSSRRDSSSSSSSMSSAHQSSWSSRLTPTSSWESGSSRSTMTNRSQEKNSHSASNSSSSSFSQYDAGGNKEVKKHRASEGDYQEGHRSRSQTRVDSMLDDLTSFYGSIRRPRSLLRYTKSITKDLSDRPIHSSDFDDELEEIGKRRMRRPRSILVLADSDDDAKEDEDSSKSSDISHDAPRYPRDDISRGGGSSGGRTSSRRDGSAGGSGSSAGRSGYSFTQRGSKNSGYTMDDEMSMNIGDKTAYGHQRNYVRDNKKKINDFVSDSDLTTRYPRASRSLERKASVEKDKFTNPFSSEFSSKSKNANEMNSNDYSSKVNSSVSLANGDCDLSDAKTGASGYWAKRYGTNSRRSSIRMNQNSNQNANKEDETSQSTKPLEDSRASTQKYTERHIRIGSLKNSDAANSVEDSIVGYARSVSTKLDQLQDNLRQRFGVNGHSHYSSISYDKRTSNSLPRRRLSIDSDLNVSPPTYHRRMSVTDGKFSVPAPEKATPEYVPSDDHPLPLGPEESVESTGSTPTPTPTPVPVSNVTNSPIARESLTVQVNGCSTNRSSLSDDRMTPVENDDSSSVCSDSLDPCSPGRGSSFDEVSVSERIRRKSYFARFQDSRYNRKGQHRKSLDINRNHHMAILDNYGLALSPNLSSRIHDFNSISQRNSFSQDHLDGSDDNDGNYPTLTRKSSRQNGDKLLRRNSLKNSADVLNGSSQTSVNMLVETHSSCDDDNDFSENRQTSQIDQNSQREPAAPSLTNGYLESDPHSISPFSTNSLHHPPSSPQTRRHSVLADNGFETSPPASRRGTMSNGRYERRMTSPTPLDAATQSRMKLRNRHDLLINRALSSIDEGTGITRPFSPTSRFSLLDNHLPDLRRFSTIMDNSNSRNVIRKAWDVCNSLQD